MSDNVMSVGIMVPLVNVADQEEVSEALYDMGSNVSLNYDGTLAYTDEGGGEVYGIQFSVSAGGSLADFDVLKEFGIEIVPEKARPYSCYWYNGTDSDMSVLTLEEFLANTNQT